MKHELQHKILEILSNCVDMTIATVRPDGAPQATVVSFVHDGLMIYFGCGAGSQKAANLARDPRVSITVTPPYGNWMQIKGLSMSGTASELAVPGEIAKVGQLMIDRFKALSSVTVFDEATVKLFRVKPDIVSVLDYTLGFGHTDVVKVEADDIAETLDTMRHHWLLPAEAP